jgi:ubiquitin-protein ligase
MPVVGLYTHIEFLVNLYFEVATPLSAPPLGHHQRIFHPNLNPYTLEFAVEEVVNWLPSNTIIEVLRRLKYTIIEPNLKTIPNNWLCKRAAYFYKIDRSNFRERIEQYLPEVLEGIVLK